MKIRHFPLEFTFKQLVQLPMYTELYAARVLGDGTAFLVGSCMDTQPEEDVEIAMYVDGQEVSNSLGPGKYLGTIQNPVDQYIYHVFDVKAV